VPSKPGKPAVKKLSTTSIQLCTTTPSGPGSNPTHYIILMKELKDKNLPDTENKQTEITVQKKSRDFIHVIQDLQPGIDYQFSVLACNTVGFSEQSEWSDLIKIGLPRLMQILWSLHLEV
jgi:hypothetical protein